MIDYVPGKQAWFEENEPREGSTVEETWIGDVADSTVPTCSLGDRIGAIRDRVRSAGWETCVVVNPERVVLGLLRTRALDSSPDATAEEVMTPGPATFRPNLTLADLVKSMREHDIKTNSLVTAPDGRLIGVLSRDDAEATLAHEAAETSQPDEHDIRM